MTNKNRYDDPDERWTMIGELVNTYGNHDEQIAWMLCRGDAAEWRIAANMPSLIGDLVK
jgi:hypothetical protein